MARVPMKAPILLTSPDYCGTLAAARCLAKAGERVWLAGEDRRAPAMSSNAVDRRLRCPPLTADAALADWLEETGRQTPGLVLYPTSDDHAWLQALHAERLRPHFQLYAPERRVYEQLLDKPSLVRLAAAVGLESPHTLVPEDDAALDAAVETVPLPVLLKQRTQLFSRTNSKGQLVTERPGLAHAFRVFERRNRHAPLVLHALPSASRPMLQQYFAEGVSGSLQLSGFIDETGDLFVTRAARKVLQRPRTLGISLCLEAAPVDEGLAAKVRALCRAVGYFGVFSAEFLQVEGRALLIDFNPRYYHFLALDVARGMPLPLLTTYAARGEKALLRDAVRAAQTAPGDGVTAFTYRYQLEELLLAQTAAGTMSPSEALRWVRWYRQHRGTLVDAVDAPDDRKPHFVDVATSLAGVLRHPGRFVRRIALDR